MLQAGKLTRGIAVQIWGKLTLGLRFDRATAATHETCFDRGKAIEPRSIQRSTEELLSSTILFPLGGALIRGLRLLRNSVVPPGLHSSSPLFPALKRRAKLARSSGAGVRRALRPPLHAQSEIRNRLALRCMVGTCALAAEFEGHF